MPQGNRVIQKFFWAAVVWKDVITTVIKHSLKAAGDLYRVYMYQWGHALATSG